MLRGREWSEAIAPVDSMSPFVLGIDDYVIDGRGRVLVSRGKGQIILMRIEGVG